MKVLLVYELIPEELNLYVFDNPTPEQMGVLVRADGLLANSAGLSEEQEQATNSLSELLQNPPDNVTKYDAYDERMGFCGPFAQVYVLGFIL